MNAKDFIFDHKEDEYEDYYFKVVGDTKEELTDKYMEMCMIEVCGVVYSKKEDIVVVQQLFPFNYKAVLSEDEELKKIFINLVNEMDV